ncbi:TPA: hypothetical protein ACHU6O_000607, partial [Streptococcus suis]
VILFVSAYCRKLPVWYASQQLRAFLILSLQKGGIVFILPFIVILRCYGKTPTPAGRRVEIYKLIDI